MQAKKKLTALLLSLCMVLGMLPMTVRKTIMRQCDNGHFYDESRFDSCPYCQEGAGVGKTVAAGTVGKTVAAVPGGAAPEADRGKTVGIIKKKIGIDPAVGFLVCVSGPHRGADYKLVAGRNFIGKPCIGYI